MEKRTSSRFFERWTGTTMGSVAAAFVLVGLLHGIPSYSQIPGNQSAADTGSGGPVAVAAAAEGRVDHEEPDDYLWDESQVIPIVLNGTAIATGGSGATAIGGQVTLARGGTYRISGILTDGQIIVASTDKKTVRLILEGADIRCSWSAPILVENAKKTVVVLAENTENYVTDGRASRAADAQADEPNAVIFSKDDLTICGAGALTVRGNVYDGISSKNGLILAGGTLDINAVDDGIRGKDYLIVRGGTITVNAGGDGLKSDNAEDPNLGYVSIETGVIHAASRADGIQAQAEVRIAAGEITLSCGGGSDGWIAAGASAKGIKGVGKVVIEGGDITVDSADDAIHSDAGVTINGGTLVLSAGDDGIHANADLTINDGEIRITKSYEGLESANANITINGGRIHIVSSDDGINVSAGGDAMNAGQGGQPGGQPAAQPGGQPGGGATRGGGGTPVATPVTVPAGGAVTQPVVAANCYLYINGGYLFVDALGDGIDSNGSIAMTDGVVIVNGPTSDMNGALDHSSFTMTGGFLLAVGSAGMAQATSTSSTQYAVLLTFNTNISPGTLVHLQDIQGRDILSFVPTKQFRSLVFSSPRLVLGATYDVYCGGNSTGTACDGLYQDGTYSPGTRYGTFVLSSVVTNVGGLSSTPPNARR